MLHDLFDNIYSTTNSYIIAIAIYCHSNSSSSFILQYAFVHSSLFWSLCMRIYLLPFSICTYIFVQRHLWFNAAHDFSSLQHISKIHRINQPAFVLFYSFLMINMNIYICICVHACTLYTHLVHLYWWNIERHRSIIQKSIHFKLNKRERERISNVYIYAPYMRKYSRWTRDATKLK